MLVRDKILLQKWKSAKSSQEGPTWWPSSSPTTTTWRRKNSSSNWKNTFKMKETGTCKSKEDQREMPPKPLCYESQLVLRFLKHTHTHCGHVPLQQVLKGRGSDKKTQISHRGRCNLTVKKRTLEKFLFSITTLIWENCRWDDTCSGVPDPKPLSDRQSTVGFAKSCAHLIPVSPHG